jgi:hypothetical protein
MSFKYFVSREGREFGPYSADELRRYVTQGRVLPGEPVREGDSGSWSTAGEVAGPIDPAAPPPLVPPRRPPSPSPALSPPSNESVPPRWAPPVDAGASPYATPATWQDLQRAPLARPDLPDPPDLHWGLLLLLNFLCFLVGIVFMFRQAAWAKKVDPASRALSLFVVYTTSLFFFFLLAVGSEGDSAGAGLVGLLAILGGVVCALIGFFDLRRTIQEVTGRVLGGGMTFFFNTLYFQYHLMEWKASRPRY